MSGVPAPGPPAGEPRLPREQYASRDRGELPAVVDDDVDLFGAEAGGDDFTTHRV